MSGKGPDLRAFPHGLGSAPDYESVSASVARLEPRRGTRRKHRPDSSIQEDT